MKKLSAILLLLFLLGCKEDGRSTRCNLVPNAGPCFAYAPRYYFDKTDGKCKEFIWGGCGGVVPFTSNEECLHCKCGQSVTE